MFPQFLDDFNEQTLIPQQQVKTYTQKGTRSAICYYHYVVKFPSSWYLSIVSQGRYAILFFSLISSV
jgi:hypothetical protein